MEFSRHVYWSGLPFPSPGDLLNPGTEPRSPTLQAEPLPSETTGSPMSILPKFIYIYSFNIMPAHYFVDQFSSVAQSRLNLCDPMDTDKLILRFIYVKIFFSRVHICVLIYDICFSLSDLLHSRFIHLTRTYSVLMKLLAGKEWRLSCKECTCGHRRGRREWDEWRK